MVAAPWSHPRVFSPKNSEILGYLGFRNTITESLLLLSFLHFLKKLLKIEA